MKWVISDSEAYSLQKCVVSHLLLVGVHEIGGFVLDAVAFHHTIYVVNNVGIDLNVACELELWVFVFSFLALLSTQRASVHDENM